MDGLAFKEVFVDVKLYGLGQDVKVSTREVILGVVSDWLKREYQGVSSRDTKGRHDQV